MEALFHKVQETQPQYQAADAQVQQLRRELFNALNVAYDHLQTLHKAERELLVLHVSQNHNITERLATYEKQPEPEPEPEPTPIRPDNVQE